jgi:hypothetical protein
MDSLEPRTARSSPPLAMRAQCTCVIRSWCTPRSRTKVSGPDSWRNRRCYPWTRTIDRAAISIPSSRQPSEPSGVASESVDKVRNSLTATWSTECWPLQGDRHVLVGRQAIVPSVRSCGSGTRCKLTPYRWRQQLRGIRTAPTCANALRTLALDDETRVARLTVRRGRLNQN